MTEAHLLHQAGDLVAGAVASISSLIRLGELKPGDRLPSEARLSQELKVSRTVVSEALRSLAALRLIGARFPALEPVRVRDRRKLAADIRPGDAFLRSDGSNKYYIEINLRDFF